MQTKQGNKQANSFKSKDELRKLQRTFIWHYANASNLDLHVLKKTSGEKQPTRELFSVLLYQVSHNYNLSLTNLAKRWMSLNQSKNNLCKKAMIEKTSQACPRN